MNGRLYDANLGRFLAPDNFVQDPYNTQNFNRYSYVLNNPLKYVDEDGEFIISALIGAAVGIIVNGINNAIHDRPFFQGAVMAGVTGFIGGGVASMIGAGAQAMSGISKFAFQTLAHAHLGGMMTAMSGGNPLHGMAAGAFGSMAGAGVGAAIGDGASKLATGAAMTAAGGLSGGIGSVIAGGNFWDGMRNGLISSGLNHAAHAGLFGKKLAIALITQKMRHLFGPDGLAVSATANVSGGLSAELEGGGIMVKTKDGVVIKPMVDAGAGAGWIEAAANGGITELYHSGAIGDILLEDYYGIRWEGNISVSGGLSVGLSLSYSRSSYNNNFVLGLSGTIGVGFSPTVFSGYGTYGASGQNLKEVRQYILDDLYD